MSRRIAIVEHDAISREAFVAVLRMEGYDVRVCSTAQSIVSLAIRWAPDVVVLDAERPPEALTAVEALNRLPARPFIIVNTAWSELRSAAVGAGCDAFFVKPSVEEVLELLAAPDPMEQLRRARR